MTEKKFCDICGKEIKKKEEYTGGLTREKGVYYCHIKCLKEEN